MNEPVYTDAILRTSELLKRPFRAANFATENHALSTLVQALTDSPDTVLQTMVDVMLDAFHVGSAGCSVLVDRGEGRKLYWPAVAGAWQSTIAGGTPEAFASCADVLDQNIPLLLNQPQRRYAWLCGVTPGIEECLLVPFHAGDAAVGTIWLVSQDETHLFDAEDLRQLRSLSRLAAHACQAATFAHSMRSMNEALVLGSLRQHEAAEAEERLNELLRNEIASRKTLEAELKQATINANQASVSKSDFLANMSHELRTPLSAILGHAQIMELGTPLSDIQQRSITQIKKGGWYLADLINEILDLAQIEAGRMSLHLEAVSLAEMMYECQTLMEPLAEPHGITLSMPCMESTVFVLGDRKRVKQVLINLLSNAIKYNRPGGSVKVECIVKDDFRVRISVSDTGEGLSEAQLSQLFQLFNRLGQDAMKVNGTGIGLVMTKRLAEIMGGTVGAESKVGTGSVFWIELKRSAAPTALPARAREQYSPAAAPMPHTRKTLLYIEDNPDNLLMIQDLMAHRKDIRLLTALDGMKGIAVARANIPDAILLDMRLPDISGLQVASILAADPDTLHIPVIAFSANAMPQDVSDAMAAGLFHYLTKPINVDEFMKTLDSALGLPSKAA